MDKHKRLLDLLPEGAKPEHIEPTKHGGWWDQADPLHDDHAHAIIEHAAIVWLMGRGWMMSIRHLIPSPDSPSMSIKIEGYNTPVSALLLAVKKEATQ
jgi:hypothetical protein